MLTTYPVKLQEAQLSITESESLSFRCNVCGRTCAAKAADISREVPSCKKCGSTLRWRSIIHVLSMELFGESLCLQDFPASPPITGIGMSDWDGYAVPLARKFSYRNTYYHQEPKLDITCFDPTLEEAFDFIISSDVFEHVPPPISKAFENMRKLLKPDGVLIFSVPYSKEEKTVEHFPDLYDYQIIETKGHHILRNVTRDGVTQTFDDLIFHGGAGATLEMRLFSELSLREEFSRAGFSQVKIHKDANLSHGIYWGHDWSLPMSARVS